MSQTVEACGYKPQGPGRVRQRDGIQRAGAPREIPAVLRGLCRHEEHEREQHQHEPGSGIGGELPQADRRDRPAIDDKDAQSQRREHEIDMAALAVTPCRSAPEARGDRRYGEEVEIERDACVEEPPDGERHAREAEAHGRRVGVRSMVTRPPSGP